MFVQMTERYGPYAAGKIIEVNEDRGRDLIAKKVAHEVTSAEAKKAATASKKAEETKPAEKTIEPPPVPPHPAPTHAPAKPEARSNRKE